MHTHFRNLLIAALLLAMPTLAGAQRLAVPGRGPANAIAVLSVPDPAGVVSAMEDSNAGRVFGRILESTGLLGGGAYAGLQQVRPELEKDLGFSIEPHRLFSGAVSGFDFYVVDERRGEKPYGVLMIQFMSEAQSKAVFARIQKDAAGATGMVKGVEANTAIISTDREKSQIMELPAIGAIIAVSGTTMIISTSIPAMPGLLASRSLPTMLTTPEFRSIMTPLVSHPMHAWFYGDSTTMGAMLGMGEFSNNTRPDPLLRTAGSPMVGAAIRMTPDHLSVMTFRPMSQLSQLEKAMVANTASTEFGSARFLPENPMFSAVFNNLDLRALVSTMSDAAGGGAMLPAMQSSGLEDFLLSLGTDMGVGISDFRLTEFADMPVSGDAVFAAKIVDANRLQGVLTQLSQALAGMGASITKETHRDAEVHTLRFPAATGADAPLAPSWAVTKDQWLLVATSDATVKQSLDLGAGNGTNFSKGPLLSGSRDTFRGRPNNYVGLDLPKVVALVSSVISSGSIPQSPESTAAIRKAMPMLEALRSCKGVLTGASYDPSGVLTETFLIF